LEAEGAEVAEEATENRESRRFLSSLSFLRSLSYANRRLATGPGGRKLPGTHRVEESLSRIG